MTDRRENRSLPRTCVLTGALLAVLMAAGCNRPQQTFAGTWKSRCGDYWGLQISQAGSQLYSVTFCGLSGCLEREQWTPDTPIEGDPMYQVVSSREIRVRRKDGGYFSYVRCSTEPEWTVSTAAGR